MTRFNESGPVDAAEKLMLDLMDKRPGASEGSLFELFQNVARIDRRALVGHLMKHITAPT